MHIIRRELRANLKSLIIWSIVLIALVTVMNQEFSAYYDNPEMADILDSIPEGMMKAFGFENANLTTTIGFVSLASFYFYLLLSVHAILLGSGIISKEERDKTAEFFMTLPVSREKIILSKYIAAMINCMVVLLATVVTIIVTMVQYDLNSDFFEFLSLLTLALFMIQMIFLSVGFLLSSIIKRYKNSGKISAGLVMGMYVLSIMSGLSKHLEFFDYITPFKYYEAASIQVSRSFDTSALVTTFLIIVLSMLGTFIIYPKRDLNI